MGTLGRLTADQLDLTRDTFDFTQTITNTLGDLGTPEDGFDSYLNDTSILLSTVGNPGDSLVDDFNLAAGIGSSIDPLSLQADATSLPASLAAGDSILSDAAALAGGVSEPAPPTSSGGTAAPSSGCSQRTNQYGLSVAGTFAGVACGLRNTFQVLRVQDGPCTYSAAQYPTQSQSSFPRIVSFTLTSGDASVWRVGHHQERASDGTLVDLYDVTITPKLLPLQVAPRANLAGNPLPVTPPATESKSHFDATATLVLSNPSKTQTVCMSVDCIP